MSADAVSGGRLSGDARRRRRERLIRRGFLAAASLSLLISAAIVLSLLGNAVQFLQIVPLDSIFGDGWFPRRGQFDIKTPIVHSLIVSAFAMVVAVPIGLGAAIFLAEYASPRVRRTVKPILEVLAGIPSVIIGYFALQWISPNVVQAIFGQAPIQTLLAASIGVGVLITPLMASVSEDALRAVPRELREAAFGLGARRRGMVVKVVLPAAVSGIVAAAILSVSRAIGETMVVTIAAGGASGAPFSLDPLGFGTPLTSAIANIATGTDAVKGEAGTFQSLFFAGIVLFVITFALNILGDRVVRRYRREY